MGKKRANGEGSIYRRKDGRWTARISLPNGERKSFYGKTRHEVSTKLSEAQRALAEGLTVPASDRLTLEGYLLQWLQSRAASVRDSTYVSYEVQIRRHIAPALGRTRLKQLAAPQVQAFYGECLAKGLSPRSVQYIHGVLRQALQAAVKWGLVARNVTDLVEPPRPRKPQIQAFNREQARIFLDTVRGDRLRALYVLALCSGLRRGELLGLRWEDVDLDLGTLAVRNSLVKVKGGWALSETKTASSRRVVKLPSLAVEGLSQHRLRQVEEKLAAGPAWQELGFVFTTRIGTPIDGNNLYREFKQILKAADLPVIPFHGLRHSAATLMLALGVQPKVVAEMLGHSRISVTMDTYSHVLPHLQEEAAAKMDALLAVAG
jgi:integrase